MVAMEVKVSGIIIITFVMVAICTVSALPAVPCSPSDQMQFVKDVDNVCGYYLCSSGTYQADPASGNLYHPCAPGTSTRRAAERSIYTPCTTFDTSCTGVVRSVILHGPGKSNNGNSGNNGNNDNNINQNNGAYDEASTRSPWPSREPVTFHAEHNTTQRPNQEPSYTGDQEPSYTGDQEPSYAGNQEPSYTVPVAVFMNAHVDGGRHLVAFRVGHGPVQEVTSRRLCHYACDLNMTCGAFEWDDASASCWLHTELTACDRPVPKDGCEHVRLVRCPEAAETGSSTTTYRPLPTTTAQPTGPDSGVNGFLERHIDGHVKRGRLVLTKATLDACLAYCMHFPACAAVDFDSQSETCWLHDKDTSCGEILPKAGCTHFKRLGCQQNGLAPMFLASFQGVNLPGGTWLCEGCTIMQCQHHCLHQSECAAVDYDSIEASCYGHLLGSACEKLKAKPGCTHFRRVFCPN